MPEENLIITKKDEIAAFRFIVQVLYENGWISIREKEKILSQGCYN